MLMLATTIAKQPKNMFTFNAAPRTRPAMARRNRDLPSSPQEEAATGAVRERLTVHSTCETLGAVFLRSRSDRALRL